MASRDLRDADSYLAAAWMEILHTFEDQHPGSTAVITATFRSPHEQAELYAQGRTKPGPIVTNCDGTVKMSNHNHYPSRALDFAVIVNGKVSWDAAQYEPVGVLAEAQGLTWGGRWTTLRDAPHIELKEPS